MTGHICIAFPNIRKPCSSKLILASDLLSFMLFLFILQHAIQMHTTPSLFFTVLNNTCLSTPISGHNAIPPIFCYRCNRVFTSYTSSSCSSGSLATLLALLCKYLSSFINATPNFLAVLLSTAFSPITYPITVLIKWNTFLLYAVHHFPL